MSKNSLNKKGIVLAIISLFIGASVTPSTSGKIKQTKNKDWKK